VKNTRPGRLCISPKLLNFTQWATALNYPTAFSYPGAFLFWRNNHGLCYDFAR